jgi:hypothetical protein
LTRAAATKPRDATDHKILVADEWIEGTAFAGSGEKGIHVE